MTMFGLSVCLAPIAGGPTCIDVSTMWIDGGETFDGLIVCDSHTLGVTLAGG